MKYYKKINCRLCNSKKLKKVLELTPTPPADSYVEKKHLKFKQKTIPLTIMLCKVCGNSQLSHVISAKEVYLNYIYETASTLGLDAHFETCSKDIIKNYNIKKGSSILDIGSNDGVLLYFFKKKGMKTLGVDPMPGIGKVAMRKYGVKTVEGFFGLNLTKKLLKKNKKHFDVITSNNLVADTDDLNGFVKSVKKLMNRDSIFFFETFYLYSQIKNFVWDFTYHEHYSYFTIKPLRVFFKKHGMEIIDLKKNNTKGGSIRVVVQLIGGTRKVKNIVKSLITKERQMKVQSEIAFKKYSNKINNGKKNFISFCNKIKSKKIAGYGASATSTTLIYHYKINEYLNYLVDDFKAKQNLYSPGFHIPVFSPKKLFTDKPDYLIILAWRYHKKILSKIKNKLKKGTKIIIPLPKFKILN